MKAIVNTAPGILEIQDLPQPEPPPGWVRVRTAACGICATDLEMIAGWERTGFPSIPGHEWCGWVDAAGDASADELVGAFCVAENVLHDGGEVGFEHAGGYAQYFLTEADKIHRLPDDHPRDLAAMIEPLAVVVRGLDRLAPRLSQPTLVFGDGPIGLLCTRVLKQRGFGPLTLVGGRATRLALAREFGADATVNYHELSEPLGEALRHVTGREFAQVIEASGSASAMTAAMELAEPEGRVLVLGDYGLERAAFRWSDLLHREHVLIGSNASAGAWPEAVGLAARNPTLQAPLVTHRLPAAEFRKGIELMQQRDPAVVKIVLVWDDGSPENEVKP